MVKSGLGFFYFEILHAPSEIPANLPGQFSQVTHSKASQVQAGQVQAGHPKKP